MKENSFNQDTPAFNAVLAQTIARHFRGAAAEATDGGQTVRLGDGLPVIKESKWRKLLHHGFRVLLDEL